MIKISIARGQREAIVQVESTENEKPADVANAYIEVVKAVDKEFSSSSITITPGKI